MSKLYIALVQQGMVLDQKCVSIGVDPNTVQRSADVTAKSLNDAQTGESEGWNAVVVELDLKEGGTGN